MAKKEIAINIIGRLDELKKAFEDGKITAEQYAKKVEATINKATTQIKTNTQNNIKEINSSIEKIKVEAFGDKFQKETQRIKEDWANKIAQMREQTKQLLSQDLTPQQRKTARTDYKSFVRQSQTQMTGDIELVNQASINKQKGLIDTIKGHFNSLKGDMGGMSNMAGQFGGSMSSSLMKGGIAVAAITTAIKGLQYAWEYMVQTVTEGIEKFKAFEQQVASVSTLLNDPRMQAPAMAKGMEEISLKSGKAFEEISSSVENIVGSGLLGENATEKQILAIADATTTASIASKANAEDVANASQKMAGAFKINIQATGEYQRILDVILKTDQIGAFKGRVAELAHYMPEASTAAKQAGLSLEQYSAQFATLSNILPGSSQISTGLKNFYAQLADTKVADKLAKINVKIRNQNGELLDNIQILKQLKKATETQDFYIGAGKERRKLSKEEFLGETFGSIEAGTAVTALMENLDALDKRLKDIQNSAGTTQNAYNIMTNTMANSSELMEQQQEKASRDVGRAWKDAVGLIAEVWNGVQLAFKKSVEWIGSAISWLVPTSQLQDATRAVDETILQFSKLKDIQNVEGDIKSLSKQYIDLTTKINQLNQSKASGIDVSKELDSTNKQLVETYNKINNISDSYAQKLKNQKQDVDALNQVTQQYIQSLDIQNDKQKIIFENQLKHAMQGAMKATTTQGFDLLTAYEESEGLYKEGDFEKADKLLSEANQKALKAHENWKAISKTVLNDKDLFKKYGTEIEYTMAQAMDSISVVATSNKDIDSKVFMSYQSQLKSMYQEIINDVQTANNKYQEQENNINNIVIASENKADLEKAITDITKESTKSKQEQIQAETQLLNITKQQLQTNLDNLNALISSVSILQAMGSLQQGTINIDALKGQAENIQSKISNINSLNDSLQNESNNINKVGESAKKTSIDMDKLKTAKEDAKKAADQLADSEKMLADAQTEYNKSLMTDTDKSIGKDKLADLLNWYNEQLNKFKGNKESLINIEKAYQLKRQTISNEANKNYSKELEKNNNEILNLEKQLAEQRGDKQTVISIEKEQLEQNRQQEIKSAEGNAELISQINHKYSLKRYIDEKKIQDEINKERYDKYKKYMKELSKAQKDILEYSTSGISDSISSEMTKANNVLINNIKMTYEQYQKLTEASERRISQIIKQNRLNLRKELNDIEMNAVKERTNIMSSGLSTFVQTLINHLNTILDINKNANNQYLQYSKEYYEAKDKRDAISNDNEYRNLNNMFEHRRKMIKGIAKIEVKPFDFDSIYSDRNFERYIKNIKKMNLSEVYDDKSVLDSSVKDFEEWLQEKYKTFVEYTNNINFASATMYDETQKAESSDIKRQKEIQEKRITLNTQMIDATKQQAKAIQDYNLFIQGNNDEEIALDNKYQEKKDEAHNKIIEHYINLYAIQSAVEAQQRIEKYKNQDISLKNQIKFQNAELINLQNHLNKVARLRELQQAKQLGFYIDKEGIKHTYTSKEDKELTNIQNQIINKNTKQYTKDIQIVDTRTASEKEEEKIKKMSERIINFAGDIDKAALSFKNLSDTIVNESAKPTDKLRAMGQMASSIPTPYTQAAGAIISAFASIVDIIESARNKKNAEEKKDAQELYERYKNALDIHKKWVTEINKLDTSSQNYIKSLIDVNKYHAIAVNLSKEQQDVLDEIVNEQMKKYIENEKFINELIKIRMDLLEPLKQFFESDPTYLQGNITDQLDIINDKLPKLIENLRTQGYDKLANDLQKMGNITASNLNEFIRLYPEMANVIKNSGLDEYSQLAYDNLIKVINDFRATIEQNRTGYLNVDYIIGEGSDLNQALEFIKNRFNSSFFTMVEDGIHSMFAILKQGVKEFSYEDIQNMVKQGFSTEDIVNKMLEQYDFSSLKWTQEKIDQLKRSFTEVVSSLQYVTNQARIQTWEQSKNNIQAIKEDLISLGMTSEQVVQLLGQLFNTEKQRYEQLKDMGFLEGSINDIRKKELSHIATAINKWAQYYDINRANYNTTEEFLEALLKAGEGNEELVNLITDYNDAWKEVNNSAFDLFNIRKDIGLLGEDEEKLLKQEKKYIDDMIKSYAIKQGINREDYETWEQYVNALLKATGYDEYIIDLLKQQYDLTKDIKEQAEEINDARLAEIDHLEKIGVLTKYQAAQARLIRYQQLLDIARLANDTAKVKQILEAMAEITKDIGGKDWFSASSGQGNAVTTLPKYQEGGTVNKTGPALLHRGEIVIPPDITRYLQRVGVPVMNLPKLTDIATHNKKSFVITFGNINLHNIEKPEEFGKKLHNELKKPKVKDEIRKAVTL